jgi:hypothetical protein
MDMSCQLKIGIPKMRYGHKECLHNQYHLMPCIDTYM